jgi:hypothetical protein
MPRTPDAVTDAASAAVRLVRRRGALAAAVTALGVGGALVVMLFVQQAIAMIGLIGQQDSGLEMVMWAGLASDVALTIVPFTAGYFLALWLVAPIASALGVRHVIARAVLATGIAATAVFLVRAIVGIVQSVTVDRPIFSNSFPAVDFVTSIPAQLLSALQGSLFLFFALLPLGILAAVFLWLWRDTHPAEFEVAGLIDV